MRTNPMPHGKGFSLAELSIVLVILGLRSIITGQNLIRAAELKDAFYPCSRKIACNSKMTALVQPKPSTLVL